MSKVGPATHGIPSAEHYPFLPFRHSTQLCGSVIVGEVAVFRSGRVQLCLLRACDPSALFSVLRRFTRQLTSPAAHGAAELSMSDGPNTGPAVL